MKRPSSPFSASAYITQNGNAPVKSGEYERTDYRYDPRRKDYLAIEAKTIKALRKGISTIPALLKAVEPANVQHFMDGLSKIANEQVRHPLNIYTLNESEPIENHGQWNGAKKKGALVL